ncbi:unnamed protein product [Toxocara canis]|uniref:Uncharacterized protein n=1 Tax=Toxocara canis TaxID=6265 RepID=A0A183VFJ7_TOXCA|nr:unnamed protein product [Toxocara canis]
METSPIERLLRRQQLLNDHVLRQSSTVGVFTYAGAYICAKGCKVRSTKIARTTDYDDVDDDNTCVSTNQYIFLLAVTMAKRGNVI